VALTESVGWLEGFISFIDTYYRELALAKFGAAKSWHVATRLAKRILDDIGSARHSAQGGFEAGNSVKICQQIFWGVLRSHYVMTEYKGLAFKNHPSVASELVKFLAINTSFEAINKLVGKVATLETDVTEAKKQVANAVKSASSAANKADDVKKLNTSLIKRIGKLEAK
jgi:hypothetical protein